MITDIDLDHVAVAVEEQRLAWPRYGGHLSGRWLGGGGTSGFWSAQVTYGNGMKVEVLEPFEVEQNDFLRRFLDRSGPGPHHLTFKVKDLRGALGLVEEAGYRPVGVNLDSPWWKEAFLHPKDAPGIVVQLAQSDEGGEWGEDPTPDWFPAPRTPDAAVLVHVTHAVADMNEATALFVDLLAGSTVASGDEDGVRWIDLAWPGPGRVRLVAPSETEPSPELVAWIDDRRGRLHHLAFACSDPSGVPGAVPVRTGVHEIAPEDNHGVRLLVAADDTPFAAPVIG
ncbi:MAG: VOC family protein [Acidimicrobiales bacterium]